MRKPKKGVDLTELIFCYCGCGRQRTRYDFRGKELLHIAGHNYKGGKKGVNNGAWKGGRYKNSLGYIMILKPDHHYADNKGYVMEHRLIWEETHNACLLPWGVAHHVNEIRDDNRPENLVGMTKSQHQTLHNNLRYKLLIV